MKIKNVRFICWVFGTLAVCMLAGVISANAESMVPKWDARGPMPFQQNISSIDLSDDGSFVAVGLDNLDAPNVYLFDGSGKVLQQYSVGTYGINSVAVDNSGKMLWAICDRVTGGNASDRPVIWNCMENKMVGQKLQPAGYVYGDHSNHVGAFLKSTGDGIVAACASDFQWPSSQGPAGHRFSTPDKDKNIVTSMAACPAGLAVIGYVSGEVGDANPRNAAAGSNLVVLDKKSNTPLWRRPMVKETDPGTPALEKGDYAPGVNVNAAPDAKTWAPLSVAIDQAGTRIASADYQGWDRGFYNDVTRVGLEVSLQRFMPSRPLITVYDTRGQIIRRFPLDTFKKPMWVDLLFTADGTKLLAYVHNWDSRGLAGQTILPTEEDSNLYVLDITTGKVSSVAFPDVISSVSMSNSGKTIVGCWNRKVYVLNDQFQPSVLSDALHLAAVPLVRISRDGSRILVADTSGVVHLLDSRGAQLWEKDMNALAPKPVLSENGGISISPSVFLCGGLGNVYAIKAPKGLVIIDTDTGAGIQKQMARAKAAGFDPATAKYVLITHNHGDHSLGSYRWRTYSGAQTVASAQTAYYMRYYTVESGYGYVPPMPCDLVVKDEVLDLAGLKVHAIQTPGHTYGSMSYIFTIDGKTFAATGDLIMPGGVQGYSGSVDFNGQNTLQSLRTLASFKPDIVLGGHGYGDAARFIDAGIAEGEATGYGKFMPPRPNQFYHFKTNQYIIAGWGDWDRGRWIDMAFGDVNGDGLPDVAILKSTTVGTNESAAIDIYLNKGGHFDQRPDQTIYIPGMNANFRLCEGHLKKDKIMDFMVSRSGQPAPGQLSTVLVVHQGNTLDYKIAPLPGVSNASYLFCDDVDGDGLPDAIIGTRNSASFTIAHQSKDGSFRTEKIPTRAEYFDMAMADVNGDGKKDIITGDGSVFLRNADGTLPKTASFSFNVDKKPGFPCYMGVGDCNGDKKPDIVVISDLFGPKRSEHDSGLSGVKLRMFYNTGDPRHPFSAEPSEVFDVPGAQCLRAGPSVGDWNGDGIDDLILTCVKDAKQAWILPGSRKGLSADNRILLDLDYIINYETKVSVADFNGDGKPDLAGWGYIAPFNTGPGAAYILKH